MPTFAQIALPVVFSSLSLATFAPTATAQPTAMHNQAKATQTVKLRIIGMITSACPEQVRKSVEPLPGVISAKGDLASKTATVEFRADEVSVDQIRKAIKAKAGFDSKVIEVAD